MKFAAELRIRVWAIVLPLSLSALACTDRLPEKRAEPLQGAVTQALANIQAPLTNVHTYTDQCFCKWGLVDASFPEIKLNDARMQTIEPRWGGRRYRWNAKIKEYEFELDPDQGNYARAKVDFPEKGVTGPITTLGEIKCDRPSHVEEDSSCALGQKRLEFNDPATDITWTFIFRRADSAIPDEPWGPKHKNYYSIIDVSAYKPTSAKDPQADDLEQNAVCWWDTLRKGGTSQFALAVADDWTLPRPGGRYGESQKEQDRYQATIAFWDHVTPNPPDAANGDFSQNCSSCHGNGPVLDSRFYRQGGGRRYKDDDRAYHNIEFPSMDLEFFQDAKVTNGGCGGDCHAYWAKGTNTCAGGSIAESYVKVQTLPALLSKHRMGVKNWEFGNQNAEVTPPEDDMDARRTLMMPKPLPRQIVDKAASTCKDPDYKGNCVIDWIKQYQEEYDNTSACCFGAASCTTATVQGKPPVYYPEQDAPPALKPYNEKVKAPSLSAAEVKVEIAGPCPDSAPACDVRLSWRDPVDGDADRYRVPRAYTIDYLEKSPANSGATFAEGDLDCRNKPPLVDPTSYESATEVSPGENSYKKQFVVRLRNAIGCGKVFKARVCGARCSGPTATEPGALSPELRRTCTDGGTGSGGSSGMADASFDGCTFERCGSSGSSGLGGCSGTGCGSGGTIGTTGFDATAGSGFGGTGGLGGFSGSGFSGSAGVGGSGTAGNAGVSGTAGQGGVDAGALRDASSTVTDARAATLGSTPQNSPLDLNQPADWGNAAGPSASSCAVQSGQARGPSLWLTVMLASAIAVALRRASPQVLVTTERGI